MVLDVRTLLAAMAVGFLLMAFMGAYLSYLHRDEKAIRYWAAGCLIIALSDTLLFFRPVLPDFLTIVVGNTATIAGGFLLYSGIAAFDRLPKRLGLGIALTATATVLIAYFTYVTPDIRVRIVVSTAAIALIMAMMAAVLLRPGIREHQLLRRVLGVLFIGMILLGLARIADAILRQDSPDMSLFSNSPLATAWLLGLLAVTFLSSLDFLLMPGQRMQLQLDELARMDDLTGLLNRRAFNRRLREAPSGATGCVMLLDIDRFKRLNDEHGHAAGDAVLRAFADHVSSQLRREDVFARFGGDEFSVLLPIADVAQAVVIAERIREALERMDVRFGDLVLKVTVSIGIAQLVPENLDLSLAQADMALYRAKSEGRNRVETDAEQAAGQAASRSSA